MDKSSQNILRSYRFLIIWLSKIVNNSKCLMNTEESNLSHMLASYKGRMYSSVIEKLELEN